MKRWKGRWSEKLLTLHFIKTSCWKLKTGFHIISTPPHCSGRNISLCLYEYFLLFEKLKCFLGFGMLPSGPSLSDTDSGVMFMVISISMRHNCRPDAWVKWLKSTRAVTISPRAQNSDWLLTSTGLLLVFREQIIMLDNHYSEALQLKSKVNFKDL